MAASSQGELQCACHVNIEEKEPVVAFKEASWNKILECVSIWKDIDSIEKKVATNFDINKQNGYGYQYHRKCYQRFTDKNRIAQGITRKERGKLRQYKPLDEDDDMTSMDQPDSTPSRKILRSHITSGSTSSSSSSSKPSQRRSIHVLPEECIICQKNRTAIDKTSMKRRQERLITCETDAVKLLEAAEVKQDQRILLQIGNFDPVCIEVRYHASCYKKYTKCLYDTKQVSGRILSESFDIFCEEIIQKKIIVGGEVLKMNSLNKQFVNTVKNVEGVEMSSYRNFQLKARLVKRYPQLQFVQPKANCCQFVFCPSDKDNIVVNLPYSSESASSEDSTSCMSEHEEHHPKLSDSYAHHQQSAQLFRCALILRNAVQSASSISYWPPDADNLTEEECIQIVPQELFNFLAWCTGLENEFCAQRVDISLRGDRMKLLSIAQDIITLASQGRKLMPKHMALGMTLRHLTGSARLQKLLNGYGHCVSHSVTLEHDTALAEQQLKLRNGVPPGFHRDTFTTLVWDNNDFGEETLSGKGTTHNTNGIIIQLISTDPCQIQPKPPSATRTRKRTIEAPPLDIPEFFAIQFHGQSLQLDRVTDIQDEYKVIDQALWFAKHSRNHELLPSWTGSNQMISDVYHTVSKIGYLPVIDASPTERSTVNSILERSLTIADTLNMSSIVLVMDQAVYAKAQEIRWQGRQDFTDRLILRLGEFHTSMAFLAVIGRRFRDAGLEDIVIDSGLVAQGSINGVMNGHHYNRSIRSHKIICEAMQQLQLEEYLGQLHDDQYQQAQQVLKIIRESFPDNFKQVITCEEVRHFTKHYKEYVNTCIKNNSTCAFWNSYLEMVELLLLFIRATREGNWELHLSCVRDMIPWFLSYGSINYSRYLPAYYFEMKSLPSTHPLVYEQLMDGEFAVQRHTHTTFSMTACDQIIEQTFNRDSKTKGGMTGITLNKGAVHRWILSHPPRAAIANACYSLTGTNTDYSSHHDLHRARINKDDQDVESVKTTIDNFCNPFRPEKDDKLINIANGVIASEMIKSDIFSAYERGDVRFKETVKERLIDGSRDIFDKHSLPTGKTFSSMKVKKKSRISLENASIKESRRLLARMLMVAQEKGLELKEVLRYPLCPVPASLAKFDGSMAKTNKAALMHEILHIVPDAVLDTESVLHVHPGTIIVDAMAMIQQQQHFTGTFGDFSDLILKQLMSISKKHKVNRIDFVADRYKIDSIKMSERTKRGSMGHTQIRIQRRDQKLPRQMKKFLSCGSNKEGLLAFLVDDWKVSSPEILGAVQLYATQGEVCLKISANEDGYTTASEIADLQSDHEEADTRMFLHALHASKSSDSNDSDIIIRTVDTDVLVLALWASIIIPARIIVHLTLGSNAKMIDTSLISKHFGDRTTQAILGLHPFTGCDTVSCFKGKGKVKTLKLMLKSPTYQIIFSELGMVWSVTDQLVQELEKFVCELYGSSESDVNTLRYNCFRFDYLSDIKMPPNKDSLRLHIMRSNYQAKIFRSSLKQHISAPSPGMHGWTVSGSEINMKWLDMPVAPDTVLKYVHCNCKKTNCNSNKCSCKKALINCTELCQCCDCSNRHTVVQVDENDSDTSDSESDEP